MLMMCRRKDAPMVSSAPGQARNSQVQRTSTISQHEEKERAKYLSVPQTEMANADPLPVRRSRSKRAPGPRCSITTYR